MNSFRILFSVTVNMEWPLFQLNVKNAFLCGNLKEEIYIKQPPGYVAQGENIVCRLKKAIYRLKQSPKVLFEKFSMIISDIGFAHCH